MAVKELTSNYRDLVTDLPGCPPALILETVRDIIIEFCKEVIRDQTAAWQCDLDPINIRNGVDTYDIDDVPGYAQIHRVLKVVNNGSELLPSVGYTMPSATEIKLAAEPQEDISVGLEVRVALRLKKTATVVDRELYDEWYDCWKHGILARLKMQKQKAWTDRQGAVYYEAKYQKALADAKIVVSKEKMNKSLMARPDYPFV